MKYIGLFILSLVIITTVKASCIDGNGQLETKRLELEKFEKLSLSTKSKIFLYQGPEQKIDVIAESNLIEYLSTKIKDGTWSVHFKECVDPTKPVEIHITLPVIRSLELNGASDLIASEVIKSEDLEVEVNGSAKLELTLEVKNLETDINGSGDIRYSGSVESHEIEISGAADIGAYELKSKHSKIVIRGAGDVKVNVETSLKIKIFGAGDIKYRGNPDQLEITKYGAGDVKKVPD